MQKKNKHIYQNRYLYSAKIYCAKHHTVFHRRIFRKDKKDITWVCSLYLKKGKTFCDSSNIRESELDAIFKDLITRFQIDVNKVGLLLMNYYQNLEVDTGIDETIEEIEKEKNGIIAKKDKLLDLSLQGSITNLEFCERNNHFNQKLKELEVRLDQLKQEKERLKKGNITNHLFEIIKQKIYSKSTFDKITRLFLDHMTVSNIENDKTKMELNIFLSYKKATKELLLEDTYEFKRGYDTKGTKRYKVTYLVKCYYGQ